MFTAISVNATVMPVGKFSLSVKYRVRVPDAADEEPEAAIMAVQNLPPDLIHYLLPSRYCQSDALAELANEITSDTPATFQRVETIRAWVHKNVRYESGSSDSSTSALETASARVGVCRDLAHLSIALCRALDIPARMVVGFLHQLNPMDLHAWFEAFIGGRWFTFDATEPTTRGNRIVLAYGRDAADVALATMFGNFTLTGMNVSVSPAE